MSSSKSSFLNSVINEAIKQDASDIIWSYDCPPTLKVHGGLVPMESLGKLTDADLQSIIEEIASKPKQEVLESERQIDLAYSQGEARFRVNAFYQRGHVSLVMRYVKANIPSIEDLGLPEIVRDLVGNDNGIILLVGPTGSGKSTSLASMLEYVNQNFDKHIITIEDPIEYTYVNKRSIIQQREIGVDATSFPAALRSALREAPDVILMGEMRDLDSISTAITVAETGHLVLSTVHANSAALTIDRIIDIFPGEAKDQIRTQLSDILVAVVSQRLVPRADGNGLMMVAEVMIANSAVRNAIRTANTSQLPTIIQTAAGEGMHLMDDLLVKAVNRGEITKEVALGFANNRNEMKKQF